MIFDDTIAAVSTPPGVGAVGIVRISGKNALTIADAVFRGSVLISQAPSHTIHFGFVVEDQNNEKVDSVLVSVMRSPKTYTGLDTVEINCHGGVVNTRKILQIILSKGARLAEPGEFTKIAFLNGKIDLSQVEAVADLLFAKTEGARKASMSQFLGNLKNEVLRLRSQLIQLCSLLEIDLDFAEENLLAIDHNSVKSQIKIVEDHIRNLLSTYHTGHIIREGAKVTILGKPNVGKSSLLNALLKKDRAIVSEIPGTTRDYIEESLDIDGIPFVFVDTAGIRSTNDDIEIHGIHYSKENLLSSDLVLAMFDLSGTPDDDDMKVMNIVKETAESNKTSQTIFVGNKADISEIVDFERRLNLHTPLVRISAKSQDGIDGLKKKISELFQNDLSFDAPMISRIRHKIALEKSLHSLSIASLSLENRISYEYVALDIRNAVAALSEIVGDVTSDEVLNNIFSNFCIGK